MVKRSVLYISCAVVASICSTFMVMPISASEAAQIWAMASFTLSPLGTVAVKVKPPGTVLDARSSRAFLRSKLMGEVLGS